MTPDPDIAREVGEALAEAGEIVLWRLDELLASAKPREPIPTGLQPLDALLGGGVGAGEAVVIGGGPGALKTTLALNIAAGILVEKTALLVVALDEPALVVAQKFAARFGGELVSEMTGECPPALARIAKRLVEREAFLRIADARSGASIEKLIEQFLREVPPNRVPVILADHLQLLDVEAVSERDGETAVIVKAVDALMRCARRGAAIIAISESTKAALNPDAAAAAPLATFAGSRRIASRFDVAILMQKTGTTRAEVRVVKNRFGKTGAFGVELNPQTWRLVAYDIATESVGEHMNTVRQKLDEMILTLRASGPLSAGALDRVVKGRKDLCVEARRLGVAEKRIIPREERRGSIVYELPSDAPVPTRSDPFPSHSRNESDATRSAFPPPIGGNAGTSAPGAAGIAFPVGTTRPEKDGFGNESKPLLDDGDLLDAANAEFAEAASEADPFFEQPAKSRLAPAPPPVAPEPPAPAEEPVPVPAPAPRAALPKFMQDFLDRPLDDYM